MSSELEVPFINEIQEEEEEARDWDLLIAFNELRHREKIQGSKKVAQTWRMKERVGSIKHMFSWDYWVYLALLSSLMYASS